MKSNYKIKYKNKKLKKKKKIIYQIKKVKKTHLIN